MTCFTRLLALCLLCASLSARAQTPTAPPLPTHAIRSISPTDTSFADLEFLTTEIGGARVVMLGEPTHGEGNVTEAKVRLIRFLKKRMGFTTVAFESGFYELDQGQRELDRGAPVAAVIADGVYPVWTETREFQPLLPLLGRGGLRIAGFDSQLAALRDELVEELEAFLKPEKGAADVAYDYLDETLSTMGDKNIFPPANSLALFNLQIGKARKLLEKVAAGPDKPRRERAAFWLQNLRSIQALAYDYAHNDPGAKDSTEFRAVDSNARDAQMADNLLWYLRQHPREKVICWGALPHLANKAEVLADAQIREYRPMGRAVKAALGPEAVYVLGTLAGGGEYGFGYWGRHQLVPAPVPGSVEEMLLTQGREYCFLSLKHDAPGRILTTSAFQYQPLTGPWSEVVDGFLFLKTVNPPHAASAAASIPIGEPVVPDTVSRVAINTINPARRPVGKAQGLSLKLEGTVLDRKTGQAVPFATVAVPARSAGTMSDARGRFRLEARRGELMQVSSIGYEPVALTVTPGPLTVRLVPAAFALAGVRVSARSQDPKRIMKKAIKAAEANYEQQDYTQQVYTRRRIAGFDTLRHEVEYVSQSWVPAGARHWAGGFLMLEARPVEQVREKHIVAGPGTDARVYLEGGYGFSGGYDAVRISPLFKMATLGRFRLQLDTLEQHGADTWYVIRFAAKRANHRATGLGLVEGYSGKVYVRQQDYAVVRYEALWQNDTTESNAVAHKYYGRGNQIARLYPAVHQDHRAAHVVAYQRAANGRYYAASSIAQAVEVGHVLGGRPFYNQKTCELYFGPPTPASPAAIPDPKVVPELRGGALWQLAKAPFHPEFWQTYQRPGPAEPVPALK